MEIESWRRTDDNHWSYFETKKISWKWRLKGQPLCMGLLSPLGETKKISWKWRLKGLFTSSPNGSKSSKQRKSPENGDWKEFSALLLKPLFSWNKENLLKMEIERQNFLFVSFTWIVSKQRKSPENGDWKLESRYQSSSKRDTKQRKSPENGDWKFMAVLWFVWFSWETKKISWKWRLKASSPRFLLFRIHRRNKENLLKMEIERIKKS